MAPLPVIADVIRCDLKWPNISGVAPHSTFHISTDVDDLEQIATELGNAYDAIDDSPFQLLYSGYTVNQVFLTPLDGTTAGQAFPLGTSFAGDSTGGILPNVCGVMSFRTERRGPQGRGRMYLGPVGEGDISDGRIDSGTLTATVQGWKDFNDELVASPVNAAMVVASYKHSAAYTVTSMSMRTAAGTMRRRQNQLL